jgi:hypothetical protein
MEVADHEESVHESDCGAAAVERCASTGLADASADHDSAKQ